MPGQQSPPTAPGQAATSSAIPAAGPKPQLAPHLAADVPEVAHAASARALVVLPANRDDERGSGPPPG